MLGIYSKIWEGQTTDDKSSLILVVFVSGFQEHVINSAIKKLFLNHKARNKLYLGNRDNVTILFLISTNNNCL